jgi:hypothetical protein
MKVDLMKRLMLHRIASFLHHFNILNPALVEQSLSGGGALSTDDVLENDCLFLKCVDFFFFWLMLWFL